MLKKKSQVGLSGNSMPDKPRQGCICQHDEAGESLKQKVKQVILCQTRRGKLGRVVYAEETKAEES